MRYNHPLKLTNKAVNTKEDKSFFLGSIDACNVQSNIFEVLEGNMSYKQHEHAT